MFVTVEGPEGAGKSTLVAALAERLGRRGHRVVTTREPGSGPFGARIRDLLLHAEAPTPLAELFLFLADRAEHTARFIRPRLAEGALVLCDRFADSTVVYQGYGRGLDLELLRHLNAIATEGLVPDLTLLLDLPPATGLARLDAHDRFDRESLPFHERIREGFLAEARREPERWVVLDASAPIEQVHEHALAAIEARIGRG